MREWLRRRRESRDERYAARMLALGYRGVYSQPEVGLPEGYGPPSAALRMQQEPAAGPDQPGITRG